MSVVSVLAGAGGAKGRPQEANPKGRDLGPRKGAALGRVRKHLASDNQHCWMHLPEAEHGVCAWAYGLSSFCGTRWPGSGRPGSLCAAQQPLEPPAARPACQRSQDLHPHQPGAYFCALSSYEHESLTTWICISACVVRHGSDFSTVACWQDCICMRLVTRPSLLKIAQEMLSSHESYSSSVLGLERTCRMIGTSVA